MMLDNETVMSNRTEITDISVPAADFMMYKIGKLIYSNKVRN